MATASRRRKRGGSATGAKKKKKGPVKPKITWSKVKTQAQYDAAVKKADAYLDKVEDLEKKKKATDKWAKERAKKIEALKKDLNP